MLEVLAYRPVKLVNLQISMAFVTFVHLIKFQSMDNASVQLVFPGILLEDVHYLALETKFLLEDYVLHVLEEPSMMPP